MKPAPVWLKAGDMVRLGIEGLGEQQQKIVRYPGLQVLAAIRHSLRKMRTRRMIALPATCASTSNRIGEP
jgi:hypothetical protein